MHVHDRRAVRLRRAQRRPLPGADLPHRLRGRVPRRRRGAHPGVGRGHELADSAALVLGVDDRRFLQRAPERRRLGIGPAGVHVKRHGGADERRRHERADYSRADCGTNAEYDFNRMA